MQVETLTPEELENVRKRLLQQTRLSEVISDISFLASYQQWALSMWHHHDWSARTFPTDKDDFLMTIGLAGETGEALEVIKKHVRDNGSPGMPTETRQKLILELGDVLYYLAFIAYRHNIGLDEIIVGNVNKLEERYEKRMDQKRIEYIIERDKRNAPRAKRRRKV